MAGQNREDRQNDQGAGRIALIKVIFFREEAVFVKQALLKGCKIKKYTLISWPKCGYTESLYLSGGPLLHCITQTNLFILMRTVQCLVSPAVALQGNVAPTAWFSHGLRLIAKVPAGATW